MTLAEEARRSVLDAGLAAGLSAAGTCTARAWDGTRAVVEARRRGGLADTMAFTYRNPVRSTDPSRLLRGAATLFVGATGYAPASVPAPEAPASARVGWYATDDFYAQLRAGLDAMAGVLRRLGFRAVVVADTMEALTQIRRIGPGRLAAVVIDGDLPGTDAQHLLQTIREQSPGMRVVWVQGRSANPEVAEPFAVLQRPVLAETLLDAVSTQK